MIGFAKNHTNLIKSFKFSLPMPCLIRIVRFESIWEILRVSASYLCLLASPRIIQIWSNLSELRERDIFSHGRHRRTRTVGFADNAYRGHPSASGRQKSVLIVLSAARKNVVWIDLEDFARSASLSIGFAKNRTNLIKSIKSLSQLFMLSLLLESPTTITTYTIFLCQILSSIVQVCR